MEERTIGRSGWGGGSIRVPGIDVLPIGWQITVVHNTGMYVGSRPATALAWTEVMSTSGNRHLAKTCSSFHLGVPDNLVCR
jgi:hypothetical protein